VISKNEIKEIRALGQKKFRDERGLFIVEGEKLVAEALQSGWEVVAQFRTEDIGEDAMARITQLTRPSPALAVVRQPDPAPPAVSSDDLVLALDGIRDPGNLGTIVRIADWFGIRQILVSHDTVEVFNPKVVQATMGAIFRVRVHYCDLAAVLDAASDRMPVFGTFLEGDTIYEAPLTPGGILVMGSEANGISSEVAATVTQKLFIPSFPPGACTSESLNVAVATAICCSEFRRRPDRPRENCISL